jgi:hypothetical protein
MRPPIPRLRVQVQISCVSNIVAWFCMWLLWLGTWLHQWHPIISPLHMANAEASTASH